MPVAKWIEEGITINTDFLEKEDFAFLCSNGENRESWRENVRQVKKLQKFLTLKFFVHTFSRNLVPSVCYKSFLRKNKVMAFLFLKCTEINCIAWAGTLVSDNLSIVWIQVKETIHYCYLSCICLITKDSRIYWVPNLLSHIARCKKW